MKSPRYLTKSRYKLGIECPTKLFYTRKKEYLDTKMDDSFLAALAEGGYQVGELAKLYFPNGHDITTLNYDEAEKQTLDLLKQENVIIYEPAIKFKNLFIRIDVLVKKGNHFDLIEVKAKSFDEKEEEPFLNKNGTLKSTWKPYLYDIAFQKHVLASAYPQATISSYLMMANKNIECATNGLNQKFKIVRNESNIKGIEVSSSLTKEDLKTKILIQTPVDDEIQLIYDCKDSKEERERNFFDEIEFLAAKYEQDEKVTSEIGSKCAKCEFKCSVEDETNNYKSGFKECWKGALGWTDSDFNDENILSVWNFRKKDHYISDGKIKLTDLTEEDISPRDDGKPGISASERQWLQIEMVQNKDSKPFFDFHGMKLEMEKWSYPLHFIDFETTAVAIPFTKGRRPYEGVAFQFSHHIFHEDGAIEHAGQYLNTEQGVFPNYDFVRELKKQLENDEGTIFRYAPHENTYLNLIYRQLLSDSADIPDRGPLCEFIKTITKSVSSSVEKWEGKRCMVDMWDLVKRYYYDPYTNGSNSIKYVLPAILNSSKYLQEKYINPIYGAEKGISSLNFKDWKWIELKNEVVVDPYKMLPKMFQDTSEKNMALLSAEDELANGGAALTAYGKMQFCEITDYEKQELSNALLKYCELDTFAMVMIYEAWREMVRLEIEEDEAA
jgi:hypothetical protein